VLLDHCELAQTFLSTSEVDIAAAVSFSREESGHLHPFSKDYEVSRATILPKAQSRGTAASRLLIDDQGRFGVACNLRKLSHKVFACDVTSLEIGGLYHNGSHWF